MSLKADIECKNLFSRRTAFAEQAEALRKKLCITVPSAAGESIVIVLEKILRKPQIFRNIYSVVKIRFIRMSTSGYIALVVEVSHIRITGFVI